MNKYEALWNYLKENKKEEYTLTFDEIEKITGFKLDHSFLTYKKDIIKYGFKVNKIKMKEKIITFTKININK